MLSSIQKEYQVGSCLCNCCVKPFFCLRECYHLSVLQEAVKSLNEFQPNPARHAMERTQEEKNAKTVRHLAALGVPVRALTASWYHTPH